MSKRDELRQRLAAIIDHFADVSLYGDLTPNEELELNWAKEELQNLEAEDLLERQAKAEEVSGRVKRSQWRGKYGERRLAKRVGGKVVGRSKAIKLDSGKYIPIDCQKPPDVVTEMFSFESKWLKEMPKFLDKVMGQAIRNCPSSLIPIGVIGDREQRTVVYIMTERDWLSLHG